jgi:hypothetical protein
MKDGSNDLKAATLKADNYYKSLQDQFAGNNEIDELLYSPEQLPEVYSGCREESEIELVVDKEHFQDYKWPSDLKDGDVYKVKEKEYRCTDEHHVHDHDPYELLLPEDYSVHFTRGLGNSLRIFFQYAYGLAETPGFNYTNVPPTGPVSKFFFFNLFEATEREAVEGTYIVTSVYVIGLFAWIFESAKRDLAREIQHNRGIIFMIPITSISKSKPIVEYVERVLQELIG